MRATLTLAVAALLALPLAVHAAEKPVAIPEPAVDVTGTGDRAVAVFAGGCFWGVQAVFQHTEGVVNAVSGYAGGDLADPTYKQVTTGTTGHAESVEITYDPNTVSYGKLLQIFFSVVHDPTQLNRQGPDIGPHYRSAIFTLDDEQGMVAAAYIAELDAAGVYPKPIVTEVAPLDVFYPAEDYHQDYATLHPDQPYVFFNDLPKIANLKAIFPEVWRETPRLVFAGNAS
jgi:peptide-methionine (S)-S-oxide reductase